MLTSSGSKVAAGAHAVHGNIAVRLFLAGSSVSLLGSRLTQIGYPLLVLYMGGSPEVAGLVAFAASAPSVLVYLPAGVFVDRANPWRVMVATEIGRGLAIAAVVVMLVSARLSVPWLIAAAVAEQTLGVFSTLAEPRFVRTLVSPDEAAESLVRVEARTHVVGLIGRPMGGFLFGIAPVAPFLGDAVSFAASAIALLRIRSMRASGTAVAGRPATAEPQAAVGRPASLRCMGAEMADGFRRLYGDGFLRLAVLLTSLGTLTAQALIMIFISQAHASRLSSFHIGMILAASGIGGAAGSFAASRLPVTARRRWVTVQMCAWWVAFGALVAVGRFYVLWAAMAMAVIGLTGALSNIEITTYELQHVNDGILARVNSFGRIVSFSGAALGTVIGGVLDQRLGLEKSVSCLFALVTVLATVSVLSPSMAARRSEVSAAAEHREQECVVAVAGDLAG
jgi:MFS family permease